ncbi:MAG: alanine dehydrogenase [Synergistaceae bacterium]|nr:alanine dehydrogenase [Synergistaceae bacterium]
MKFGVLKEIKEGEFRVTLVPSDAATLIQDGHQVYIQSGAGEAAGFPNKLYEEVGCTILANMEEMYKTCDFLAKVKEIEAVEYPLIRENQIIYCCIHPASHPEEVDALLKSKCIAITAEDSHRYGSLNCEAAGKQGALLGLYHMQTLQGGKGKFVSGLAGSPGINVLILGGGLVGKSALRVLEALGAWCTVMDINVGTLKNLQELYAERINTQMSTRENIRRLLPQTDLIINSVKWPKGNTDYLITRDMLKLMEKGSVIVDIANDSPGAIESFRETTHENPTYIEEGIVHYGVSNIPSLISRSVSEALSGSILQHFRNIMNLGLEEALRRDGYLRRSLTAYKGYLTHEETSAVQNKPWIQPEVILELSNKHLDPAPPATVSKSDFFIKL